MNKLIAALALTLIAMASHADVHTVDATVIEQYRAFVVAHGFSCAQVTQIVEIPQTALTAMRCGHDSLFELVPAYGLVKRVTMAQLMADVSLSNNRSEVNFK